MVCFITTAGYLRGRGFQGMREYLRRRCSHGWIIDVSPEGMRPEVNTRIFPGVQQPLVIALFIRGADTSEDEPAQIVHRTIEGLQQEKYDQLAALTLSDENWRDVRSKWQAPFTPAAESDWDDFPACEEMMPWASRGLLPSRTWVYAPSADTLRRRWEIIVAKTDSDRKAVLFRESVDARLDKVKQPLPSPAHQFTGPFRQEQGPSPEAVRIGYGSTPS